jgi:hypothetical protein
MALDVMEAVRLHVDGWRLDFLRGHVCTAAEFFERRDGVVRVTSRLTPTLSESAPLLGRAVAPWAEHVARTLDRWWRDGERAPDAMARGRIPTPLTQTNRSAGRGGSSGVLRELTGRFKTSGRAVGGLVCSERSAFRQGPRRVLKHPVRDLQTKRGMMEAAGRLAVAPAACAA